MPEDKKIRILVVDDEIINLQNIDHVLTKEGYHVETASCGKDAVENISHNHFDLVLTDLKMPDIDGVQVMKIAKEMLPDVEVIIITGYATVNSAVEAMAEGAFYYMAKPIKLNELRALVKKALAKTLLRNEINRLKQHIMSKKGVPQFVCQNPAVLKLKDNIAQVAQLDCNILIVGETGTGKELVARTIFELSPRANRRFLPINCGALTEELMLNELFGHEKDAYTGASKWRKGLLESADGGVVLLDEIGEMPMNMQVKLLRVLQEKKIMRVGGTKEIPVDVRILAATNRDLQDEIQKGRFRQDLYYRLNVVTLSIPPLRERKDDIPQIVRHFLAKYPAPEGRIKSIEPRALAMLQDYDYPGNVRELENIIERTLALCGEPEIKAYHLPSEFGAPQHTLHIYSSQSEKSAQTLEDNERDHIMAVLKSVDGNKTQAAKILEIDRVSLWRKLKKYEESGFNIDEFLQKK